MIRRVSINIFRIFMRPSIFFVLILLLLNSGCTATSIMKGYIGEDVTMASLDYGYPTNVVDLPDGSRAFQWIFNNQYQVPTKP